MHSRITFPPFFFHFYSQLFGTSLSKQRVATRGFRRTIALQRARASALHRWGIDLGRWCFFRISRPFLETFFPKVSLDTSLSFLVACFHLANSLRKVYDLSRRHVGRFDDDDLKFGSSLKDDFRVRRKWNSQRRSCDNAPNFPGAHDLLFLARNNHR